MKDLWALRLPVTYEEFGSTLSVGTAGASAANDGTQQPSQVMYSSQAQAAATDTPRDKLRRAHRLPSLPDSLGLLYLGAILLRIPLGMADLRRYVCLIVADNLLTF